MARNRKHQSAAIRFGPAIRTLLICLLIGGSGVGYVWQQNQLLELGKLKGEKEKRLNTLRMQNSQLARQLTELQSLKSLESRVRELKLGLTLAQPAQIVRLSDGLRAPYPEPAPAISYSEPRYAARSGHGLLTP